MKIYEYLKCLHYLFFLLCKLILYILLCNSSKYKLVYFHTKRKNSLEHNNINNNQSIIVVRLYYCYSTEFYLQYFRF